MRRVGCILAVLLLAAPALAAERPIDFNRDIRPILSDRCIACHGPDEKKRATELRLDDEKSAKGDLGGYQAIVPGKPAESELVLRITSDKLSMRMPPRRSGKTLSVKEIELLKQWIAQGAVWAEHWAWVPPHKAPLPPVQDRAWPRNPIDFYLLARLEQEGVRPSPDAGAVTRLRRLYFDLLGLPPSPEEVQAFLSDKDPQAWERLVDRLLASDHYGERMAIYWLDLVRYADTVGYHGDQDHHASPYRDYVIDAFNLNLPFDQFTREQLAGDLLPDSTTDQKIATCYNRLLQTSHEGGVQPKEYLSIYAADRVRSISGVWMGATMGCAQCHDHKYDPFTTKDFYSMVAFFADVDEAKHFKAGADAVPTRRPPEITVLTRREREQVEAIQKEIDDLDKQLASAPEKFDTAALKQQLVARKKERDAIQKAARKVMVTESIEPRTIRVLPRGNWLDDSGPIVQPAVPQFLPTVPVKGRRPTRLDLANWLVDPEHGTGGLSARVFVNRLWYLFFGAGLSRSLDDFGGQGEPPDHPALLDYLALEFINSGWDVKHMVKLIVTSRAYAQDSIASSDMQERDPENRLFARQGRWRLPAEMVRDNALAISGLLVRDIGGASVKPYQPAGYYRHLNFPKRDYHASTDARQWRRGLYVHWQRQFLHPMLKAFDAPSREECTAQRPRSNTPLAALVLLNDPTFLEAARAFATRIVRDGKGSDPERIDRVFRLAVSRSPDEVERKVLLQLLTTSRQQYDTHTASASKLTHIGQSPVPPALDARELAAWTVVCRAVLNLNETYARN